MELECKVQHYDWGKLGDSSMVAKFLISANPNVLIDENKSYAELWMGTHTNGPSIIIDRGVLLSEYIKNNSDSLGPNIRNKFGDTLPFLFKVLSIRKALSIQAHPNKEHAVTLHATFPDLYKDANHKPELAIALTPFEALCGFRILSEIKMFLNSLPEFRKIFPQSIVDNFLSLEENAENSSGEGNAFLKELFNSLMTCDKETIATCQQELLARLETEDEATQATLLYPLVRRLHEDFPGDVGCWAPYIFNYLRLNPGQAIYLGPNLPHAYLSGDCIECMACSDNVVRAGLTPKFIDVPTLVNMLDYTTFCPRNLLLSPQMEDENSCIWKPSVQDFAVVKIVVPTGDAYNSRLRHSPSILLVVSGTGTAVDGEPVNLRSGTVLFLKASRQLTLTAESALVIYQALVNF